MQKKFTETNKDEIVIPKIMTKEKDAVNVTNVTILRNPKIYVTAT